MPDEGLRQDFDGCVNLYKDFVKKSNVDRKLLGITALSLDYASGNKSALLSP